MDYCTLTGTGITVSRFCLGSYSFADQVDEKAAIKGVEMAFDRGINFFDSANTYMQGESEVLLGKALEGKPRDTYILSTKVGQKFSDALNSVGLSRVHILQQIENSLRRLKTDYVDIYYMHSPCYQTPLHETLETMDTLLRSGKIRYIGSSNYAAWQICQIYYEGKIHGKSTPVVHQQVYNMLTRGIEQEFIPFAKHFGTGVIAYNAIAGGLLTDAYAENYKNAKSLHLSRYYTEENIALWKEIKALADRLGITVLELAMRWMYTSGNVDCILVGYANTNQLAENLKTLDGGRLSAEVMDACDALYAKVAGSRFRYNR